MILIKDSLVVDGTGSAPQRVDVLIKDNKISAIGKLSSQKADQVIDGVNLMTTPGFIDINTDSDHYLSLFTDPSQHDFLLQGVTTIIGGHCGSSLAPLLRGTLQSIRKWGDVNQVNVDWATMKEFLATFSRLKLGVNFGTLVGHATIRRALIGDEARDLTAPELELFESILKQSLEEGALGMSTGLGYNHGKNTPYAEIKVLAQIVKKYNGLYATHLRNEKEDIVKATAEAVSIAEETSANTLVTHFRAIKGFEKEFEAAKALMESSKADIHFDSYPFDYSMLPIYTLLPEWAKQGSREMMLAELNKSHTEEEVLKTLPNYRGEDLVVARAPGFSYLVGKTLGRFAKSEEITVKKALVKLMKVTNLKAVLFNKNINLKKTCDALASDKALVASNSPSLVDNRNILENERAAKTFSRFLEINKDQPIEWVIEKITHRAAQKLNLKNRGVLKEGAIADIAILKDNKPLYVILGGELVVSEGKFQEIYNGSIIKRS